MLLQGTCLAAQRIEYSSVFEACLSKHNVWCHCRIKGGQDSTHLSNGPELVKQAVSPPRLPGYSYCTVLSVRTDSSRCS